MAGSQATTVEREEETVTVEPREKPGEKPREQTRTKKQPPYAVILHNDNINGFGWVVGILAKSAAVQSDKGVLADDESTSGRVGSRVGGEPGGCGVERRGADPGGGGGPM